ncbi:MAG: prenyltransferase/squalene oxidase repeat-containing protein, partial [Promethearchaeota archaeon]
MKHQKYYFIVVSITFLIMLSFIVLDGDNSTDLYQDTVQILPQTASCENNDNIESIFSAKLSNYSDLGYFPQIYESSLQATYYAIHALNTTEKLGEINQTKIVNYIMTHYNSSSHIFMDKYAYRYLDTDISKVYYPLSSVLEINCYAILSLDILGQLDLIEIQDSIDFIWSCYNPATSGFIGQPYDSSLPDFFKTSTMDNTYFAIIALDLLMNNWVGHPTERNALIQYINGLQSTSGFQGAFGGFSNDEDSGFNTLEMYEPNLLSSYYCVKSLEIFDMVDTIRISDFHQYLGVLYDSDNNFFIINYESSDDNFINIVATAIGLELSDLTSFTGINRGAVVDFILNNRNSWGTWDGSTDIHYHELIDTFQVLRSFKDAGEIYRLGPNDSAQIATAIQNYYHYNGYSLLSRDYTSQKLLYSIVNAFKLYDRISDLDLQDIYSNMENTYYYNSYLDCQGFIAHTKVEEERLGFRSRPIEYYASGHHEYITEIDTILSHKSTFMALDTLEKTFKLDDFDIGHDLEGFLEDITDSQFLDQGYDNYGAFLPFLTFTLGSPEYQNNKIFFEYSYYAIKNLELLVDYLELPGINNITDLDFNENALYSYIFRNIVETPTTIYFNPQYTDNIDIT